MNADLGWPVTPSASQTSTCNRQLENYQIWIPLAYHLQKNWIPLQHITSKITFTIAVTNTMIITMLSYEMLDQHLLLDRECLSRFPNLKNFHARFDMISIQIQNDKKGLKSWRPWQLTRSRQSLYLATTLLQLGEPSRAYLVEDYHEEHAWMVIGQISNVC